jgi:outer membrane lipoprotein carrier protein
LLAGARRGCYKARMKNLIRIALCLFFAVGCAAAPVIEEGPKDEPVTTKKKESAKHFKEDKKKKKSPLALVEARYTESSGVKANLIKTVKLEMLERTKTYKGEIFIGGQGRFRMETVTPQKSLVIVDQKGVWVVDYPSDPEFDNTIRVLRSTSVKNLKSQALVSFLLGSGSLLKHYKIRQTSISGDVATFRMEPKSKDVEIKKMTIAINKKDKEILSITYWDNLDNEVKLAFSEQKFDVNIPNNKFKYTPPKNAEVTNI